MSKCFEVSSKKELKRLMYDMLVASDNINIDLIKYTYVFVFTKHMHKCKHVVNELRKYYNQIKANNKYKELNKIHKILNLEPARKPKYTYNEAASKFFGFDVNLDDYVYEYINEIEIVYFTEGEIMRCFI